MEDSSREELWQAVHAAFERHDPAEARRLLQSGTCPPDCSWLAGCSDEDFLRWLLSHRLLPSGAVETGWPSLQELQLQCDALAEADRPACVLRGEVGGMETQ